MDMIFIGSETNKAMVSGNIGVPIVFGRNVSLSQEAIKE